MQLINRRVSGWFFGLAGCVALLCFPAGIVASRIEMSGIDCTGGNMCFSANEVQWWLSDVLALFTVAALAIVSVVLRPVGITTGRPPRRRRPAG